MISALRLQPPRFHCKFRRIIISSFFGENSALRQWEIAGAALGTVIARRCGSDHHSVDTSLSLINVLVTESGISLGNGGDLAAEISVRVSVPVTLSDGLRGVGDSVLAMIMGRIGSQFVDGKCHLLRSLQRVSTIFITGIDILQECFIIGQTLGRATGWIK